MSEPSSKYSRGRGRGKDLTPSERVAQWVNQREARRLNKERWSNREEAFLLSEQARENEMELMQETKNKDGVNGKEKSKSKRTPQVQLYVPPSLRAKKAQSLSDGNSDQREMPNPEQGTDNAVKTLCESLPRPLTSDEPSLARHGPRGRGRGRKKPEVEVYVPRALRAAQKQSKAESPPTQEINSDSKKVESDGHNDSSSMDFCPETNTSSPKDSPTTENFSDVDEGHSQASEKNDRIPNIDPEPSGLTCKAPEEEAIVFQNTCVSEDSSSHTEIENSYTFEFYDPAVVAFMPSSPMPKTALENVNNSSVNEADCSKTSVSVPNGSPITKAKKTSDHQLYTWKKDFIASDASQNLVTGPSVQVDTKLSSSTTSTSSPLASPCEDPSVNNECSLTPRSEAGLPSSDAKRADPPESYEPVLSSFSQNHQATVANLEDKGMDTKLIEEDAEDSWDTMFDDNGDCLDESLMDELIQNVGNVEVSKPKIDYLKFEPKELDVDVQAFSHIVEIYDFSPELATCDLISAFRDFASRGFDVKWVDDTHALGVFSHAVAANEALQMIHPLLKVRPMSHASKQGLNKARHCQEFLQPYKARPETTSIAARRLVAGALGMAPRVSREVRDKERQKLREAKAKRRQEKQQKVDVWDGSFGKCAMDEV